MTDRDMTQPTEHEERVVEEMEEQTGEPVTTGPPGSTNRIAGDPGAPSYAEEVEAERRGTTARELEAEEEDEGESVVDAAYKPRTG